MTPSYHSTPIGWIGSVLLHVAVGYLLYISVVPQATLPTKYIELTLGSLPGGEGSLPNFPLPKQSDAVPGVEQTAENLNNPVTLPTRSFAFGTDDVIHLPATKRSVNTDPSAPLSTTNKISPVKEDRTTSYFSPNQSKKEGPVGIQAGGESGNGIVPGRSGAGKGGFGSGDGIGDNVSFGVAWVNGGNRKLLGGDVPTYPNGVNVTAQIKLRVRVMPDGTVRSVAPAQKGDTRLENAAISKVKLWRFEPLSGAQTPNEQDCTITFNFTLR